MSVPCCAGTWCAKAWSRGLRMCGLTSSPWTSDSTSCATLTWTWILLCHWTCSKTTRISTITLSNPMKGELLWVMRAAGWRQINLAWFSGVTSCTRGSTVLMLPHCSAFVPWEAEQSRGTVQTEMLYYCKWLFGLWVLCGKERKVLPNLFQWSSCQFESRWLRCLIALWIRLASPYCPSTLSCFEQ